MSASPPKDCPTVSVPPTRPVRHLSWVDAVSVVMGIVIGAGIFMTPGLVARNSSGGGMMLLAWVFGGLLCLCGALSYAELASAYPRAGGEYTYLSRAFGKPMGFFFVWARATVIQTGSIAAAAYIFGDYAATVFPLGSSAPMTYALLAAATLTALNAIGLQTGKWTQNLLTAIKIAGVMAIVLVGLCLAPDAPASPPVGRGSASEGGVFSLGMVFVLYTFGGWSEAAYVAGEVRHARRNMLRVLVVSIVGLTVLYLATNIAYLRILGLEGMRQSSAVAADAMFRVAGRGGAVAVSVLVAASALGAMNGCIFTGARAICAVGDDFPVFRRLSRWQPRFKTPLNAILLQGAIVLVLILLPGTGPGFRQALGSGFEAAVEYTAPVFWMFLLLTSLSLFILRRKDPAVRRPFRVPLYPFTVILFALMCAYMLYSSLAYTKLGALAGLGVLVAGVPVYFLICQSPRRETAATELAGAGQPNRSAGGLRGET